MLWLERDDDDRIRLENGSHNEGQVREIDNGVGKLHIKGSYVCSEGPTGPILWVAVSPVEVIPQGSLEK